MRKKIKLELFNKVLSGFDKITVLSISVPDCSILASEYEKFGVTGYRIGDFSGNTFIHRYLPCSFFNVPMLLYKNKYLIPMVFRESLESYLLFSESHRFASFLLLLEWEVKHQSKKVIVEKIENHYSYADSRLLVVDTSYLTFRLTEIIDGASFPMSQMETMDEFIEWNKKYKLIDNQLKGKHSKILNMDNENEKSEFEMVVKIIQNKYPKKKLFPKMK